MSILIVKVVLIIAMILLFIVGYLVGMKFKYKLVLGYDHTKRYSDYIEKKMCKHYGIPLMILSIVVILLILINQTTYIYYFVMVGFSYVIFIPNYVVIKKLKKNK